MKQKLDPAHATLKKHDFQLRLENMRGPDHQTEFFLYNTEPILIAGGTSLDREDNKTIDHQRPNTAVVVNGKEVIVTQYEHWKHINRQAQGLLMVRLYFAVHSFINLYVWDPKTGKEIYGSKIKEQNQSTK